MVIDVHGVGIGSNVHVQPIDHAHLWSIYERSQSLDIPIFIHPIIRSASRTSTTTGSISSSPFRAMLKATDPRGYTASIRAIG